jgi:hypothetical protein
MKTIYKYPLPYPTAALALPLGARILSAGLQDDQIVIWALVDPRPPVRTRDMQCLAVNTGMILPDNIGTLRFLTTLTTSNGIVWHVFCEHGGPTAVLD